MKTATLPPLRVEAELRSEVERLLEPGESLSGFIERAVRESVSRRAEDLAFAERALASRARAKATGKYHSAASVLTGLRQITAAAKKKSVRKR
jgi:hypothetical protein